MIYLPYRGGTLQETAGHWRPVVKHGLTTTHMKRLQRRLLRISFA